MSLDVLVLTWKHSRHSGSTLLALLALSQAADDDGVLWLRGVTVKFIGAKARVKKRQTQNILRELEASGEVYAPPAAGRGNTTRYFVTIGLDTAQIAAVLVREFNQSRAEADHLAAEIIDRQARFAEKMQASAPIRDDGPAPKRSKSPEKAQSSAPIKKKVQSSAPIRDGDEKKVQSSTVKGAIQYHENGTSEASGRVSGDPIGVVRDLYTNPSSSSDASHEKPIGGGGDGYIQEVRRLLSSYNIMAARKIAVQYEALNPRPTIEAIRASVEALLDPSDPKSLNRLARRLQDDPPVAAPYTRPSKPAPYTNGNNGYVPPPPNALKGEALAAFARRLRPKKDDA